MKKAANILDSYISDIYNKSNVTTNSDIDATSCVVAYTKMLVAMWPDKEINQRVTFD